MAPYIGMNFLGGYNTPNLIGEIQTQSIQTYQPIYCIMFGMYLKCYL